MSMLMASQAWAQNDPAACPRRPVTGRIVEASPEVRLARSIVNDPQSSQSQIQVARDSCRSQIMARSNNRRMYDAYMCVGEANMRLGEYAGSVEHPTTGGAACNFITAALLAGSQRDARRRADAYALEGNALSERARDLGGRDARLYLFEARDAYQRAIEDQTSPQRGARHLALADVYFRLDEQALARQQIDWAQSLPGSADTASAYVRLIEAARNRTPPESWANLRPMAELARRDDPNSAGAASLLGQALFPAFDARRHLEDAIRVATPGEQRFVPDAHYYLSLLDQRAGNLTSAREHAVAAGSGRIAYTRQACLVNILIGRGAVGPYREDNRWRDPDLSSVPGYAACRTGVSPEARLLEGMFWLRRAQRMALAYGTVNAVGAPRWHEAVGQAQVAFSTGRLALREDPANATPRPICEQQQQPTTNCVLNWPGYEQITLAQALDFGSELSNYFGRSCNRPEPQRGVEARGMFLDYQIFAASARPCLPEQPN